MELLTDRLEGWPASPPRPWLAEADARQPVRIGKIGHLQRLYDVAPQVPGQRKVRWQAGLSQMAIPLGPDTGVTVGQVHGIHDPATLPAVVRGRIGPGRRIGPCRHVPKPRSLDRDRVDVRPHAVYAAPGDSSALTSRATCRARPFAINCTGA